MPGKTELSPTEYMSGEPGVYRRPSSMSVSYHPGMAVLRRATIPDSAVSALLPAAFALQRPLIWSSSNTLNHYNYTLGQHNLYIPGTIIN